MPSPFPGMDPYLEHPAIFPGLHDSFVTYIREALQPKLPEPYYAEISDRLWVEVSDRSIEPDVNVLEWKGQPEPEHGGDDAAAGGAAVATQARTTPVVVTVPHDEFREPYVDIMARIEGHERVVTTIEVLSLTNKTPGRHGRELYLQKQREVLESDVSLVEIDLLRGGEHTTAVPLGRARRKTGAFDYHVCVHWFDRLEIFYVYPFTVRDVLPEIIVPLLPQDGAVLLDVQEVFQRCYDTGPYRRRVRYGEAETVPPLTEADAQWAAGLVREASKP